MFTVTDKRMETARGILEEYALKLDKLGKFDTGLLEKELRDAWGTGYNGIKCAMLDLHKTNKGGYARLAEYYMFNQAPEGMMNSSFKRALGIR